MAVTGFWIILERTVSIMHKFITLTVVTTSGKPFGRKSVLVVVTRSRHFFWSDHFSGQPIKPRTLWQWFSFVPPVHSVLTSRRGQIVQVPGDGVIAWIAWWSVVSDGRLHVVSGQVTVPTVHVNPDA